ncbi:MAG: nucleoside phosphorylase, partial [Planctomycetota bacterium]
MRDKYPILEFDGAREAVIEPSQLIEPIDVPEHCVLCFFQEVIGGLVEQGRARLVKECRSELGPHPLHEIDADGARLAVFHPGVGAPLAGALLDELIAFGCRKFIVCGGAGVLDKEIAVGHIIVPTSAVRDEGTSYHYLPPNREVSASPEGVAAIERTLGEQSVGYVVGKTWTTDG